MKILPVVPKNAKLISTLEMPTGTTGHLSFPVKFLLGKHSKDENDQPFALGTTKNIFIFQGPINRQEHPWGTKTDFLVFTPNLTVHSL